MRKHTLYHLSLCYFGDHSDLSYISTGQRKGEKASGLQAKQLGSREKEAGEQHQDPELSREIPHFAGQEVSNDLLKSCPMALPLSEPIDQRLRSKV